MTAPLRTARIIPLDAARRARGYDIAARGLADAARDSAAAGSAGMSAMQEVMAALFAARAGDARRTMFRGG